MTNGKGLGPPSVQEYLPYRIGAVADVAKSGLLSCLFSPIPHFLLMLIFTRLFSSIVWLVIPFTVNGYPLGLGRRKTLHVQGEEWGGLQTGEGWGEYTADGRVQLPVTNRYMPLNFSFNVVQPLFGLIASPVASTEHRSGRGRREP